MISEDPIPTLRDPAGLLPGQELAGRYRIERRLGEGGMGEVYLARHLRTGRPLAVKLLGAMAAKEPENLQRFEREARALGALGHPSIVGVHDFAETPEGRPFLVMDYLEGEELAARLEREGALPWPEAARIFEEVAGALHAAHQAGVLHRDLKPGNIFLARAPGSLERVMLLDFGLARDLSDEEARLTRTGMIVGTPLYMSPEQARGYALDARSDVYSLAAVLFELLSGRPPFEGTTWTAILTALLLDPPPHLSDRVPAGLPAHLDRVVRAALAKEPSERPPDVARFAEAVLGRRPAWARDDEGAPWVPATGPIGTPAAATGPNREGPEATARTMPSGAPVAELPLPTPAGGAPVGVQEAGAARGQRRFVLAAAGLLIVGALVGVVVAWSLGPRSGPGGGSTSPGATAPPAGPPRRARLPDARIAPAPRDRLATAPALPGAADAGAPGDGASSPRERSAGEASPRPSGPRTAPAPMYPRAPTRPPPGEARARPIASRPAAPLPPVTSPGPGPRRPLTQADMLAMLPANERAMFAAMKRSDYAGCLRESYQGPQTQRVLQMRVSCAWSIKRYGTVKATCRTFQKRWPSHPFSTSCNSMLRAVQAIQGAAGRSGMP